MDIDFLRKLNTEEQNFEEPAATLTANTFSENYGLLKYARFLVYILVFLVPLFFLPWTSEILDFNKQFLIFILAIAGLILYLGQAISAGKLTIKKSIANYAVLIFIGAVLLAFLFSDFKYQSLFGGFTAGFQESLISLLGFAILFFLILNVFGLNNNSVKKDTSKLLNIFGISLFLTLVLGVLDLFGITVFKIFGITQKNFNTVGTLNSLGMLAAFLLVFSLAKLSFGEKAYFNYLRIPAAVLSLFFLLILNWWILWLAVISGMIFMFAAIYLNDWNYLKNPRIISYLWPLIIIGLTVIFIFFNFNLAGIFRITLPLEVAPSFSASLGISNKIFQITPFFGVGPENFTLAYDLYKPVSINNTAFWNARFSEATSELFNSFISYGTIGFFAFIFLIWIGFRLSLRNLGLLSIFSALVAVWVLYPFNMALGFSFWFVFGTLALSASEKENELTLDLKKSPSYSLIGMISFIVVIALSIAGSYFMTSRYAANMKFSRALANQDVDRQTQLLADAINLNRNEGLYPRVLAGLLISRINQELKDLNNTKDSKERQNIISRIRNFSSTAINLSNEISQRNPEDSLSWLTRALVYENLIDVVNGSDAWAIKMYGEYSKLSPKDPAPYLKSGNINLARAGFLRRILSPGANLNAQNRANLESEILVNLKLAEENYKKAIELKPNYVLAIYNLGATYEREGRVKDAITQLEITKDANSSDANIALQLGLLYYRDNQKDRSFNEFQRAITIFSDFSNARWYLALLYEERGELASALKELNKIKEFNPDNQILKNKISQLEKGIRSIPPQRITGVEPLEERNQQ